MPVKALTYTIQTSQTPRFHLLTLCLEGLEPLDNSLSNLQVAVWLDLFFMLFQFLQRSTSCLIYTRRYKRFKLVLLPIDEHRKNIIFHLFFDHNNHKRLALLNNGLYSIFVSKFKQEVTICLGHWFLFQRRIQHIEQLLDFACFLPWKRNFIFILLLEF